MKKCVSILVGVLAVIAAAGANIVDLGAETLPIAG